MRVIAKRPLRVFWRLHPSAEQPLKAWFAEAIRSDWSGPAAVKNRYPHASVLPGNRVVFNIGGNKYRLIVRINYAYRTVYIRFIGTHAEYDKINAEKV